MYCSIVCSCVSRRFALYCFLFPCAVRKVWGFRDSQFILKLIGQTTVIHDCWVNEAFTVILPTQPARFARCRYSSVGIATCYGVDGPGIKARWVARLSAPVQTSPGAHLAPYTMGTGSFPVVNRPGRGVDHQTPSSAEVKERVELCLYSPSGPSWPVLGRILPLPLL